MAGSSGLFWWPFPVSQVEPQSEEYSVKIAFLERATANGLNAFADGSDCGAIARDGREGHLIWRGKQRCELVLIDDGAVERKVMYVNRASGFAFLQAASEAIEWLSSSRAIPEV